MIKTILVPVSGTASDSTVFATALALGKPLGAHLAFYHVRLTTTEAALYTPHMAYCVANGMPETFEYLNRQIDALSACAHTHVIDFCRQHGLALEPEAGNGVTASWNEESREPEEKLLTRVRRADLAVLGRQHHADYMPVGLIEKLLLDGGRPLVIAPDGPPPTEIGTLLIGWQDKRESARALTAAMPLIKVAKRVIIAQVLSRPSGRPLLEPLARHLERHGIRAEIREILEPFKSAEAVLPAVAAECCADLLVIGAYGKGRLREALFGGVTRTVIDGAELPVFLFH